MVRFYGTPMLPLYSSRLSSLPRNLLSRIGVTFNQRNALRNFTRRLARRRYPDRQYPGYTFRPGNRRLGTASSFYPPPGSYRVVGNRRIPLTHAVYRYNNPNFRGGYSRAFRTRFQPGLVGYRNYMSARRARFFNVWRNTMRLRRAVISDRRAEDDPWLWREMYRIRQRRSPERSRPVEVKEEPVMDIITPPRPDRKRKREDDDDEGRGPIGGSSGHQYEEDDDDIDTQAL